MGGGEAAPANDSAPGEKTEDLYVFRMEHVTLRKGERRVMPVSTASLPYRDFFKLEIVAIATVPVTRQIEVVGDTISGVVHGDFGLMGTVHVPLRWVC